MKITNIFVSNWKKQSIEWEINCKGRVSGNMLNKISPSYWKGFQSYDTVSSYKWKEKNRKSKIYLNESKVMFGDHFILFFFQPGRNFVPIALCWCHACGTFASFPLESDHQFLRLSMFYKLIVSWLGSARLVKFIFLCFHWLDVDNMSFPKIVFNIFVSVYKYFTCVFDKKMIILILFIH